MNNREIYSNMTYNPFAIPVGKNMSHYQLFTQNRFWQKPKSEDGKYDGWGKDDIDLLIKFVVIIVDPESPLYEEKSYDLRVDKGKKALAIFSGSMVEKEINQSGEFYSKLLFEFFKTINTHLYETWFSMKMNVHQMNSYLRLPPIPDKNGSVASDINARRQLSQVITELTYELIEIEYQLFPDARLAKIINDRSSDDGLGGYAEQYAENPNYGK